VWTVHALPRSSALRKCVPGFTSACSPAGVHDCVLGAASPTQAYCVGPPPTSESYLNIPAILDAIQRSGAQAVGCAARVGRPAPSAARCASPTGPALDAVFPWGPQGCMRPPPPPPPAHSRARSPCVCVCAFVCLRRQVHPGYGFLSEKFYFADAIEKLGVKFLGPPSPALIAMGDKINSKTIARKAKVGSARTRFPFLVC
jgi:hypothetical protein